MKFKVTSEFDREFKRLSKKYKSLKSDIKVFTSELRVNPFKGEKIFTNCRKARFAIKSKGKGKSGGGRVFFYYEVSQEYITLLYIYDKSEMENIQKNYIKQILRNNLKTE